MPIIRRPLFLYLCIALVTSSVAQQHRKHSFRRHLPPPAHLRVVDPSTADDAELLDGEESQGVGGGGKKQTHQKNKQTNGDDEDKPKTLSQQVADGKYGLIQNELFRKPPKRPGVISYNDNPEVPNDTASNFGGLNENEIWLAENHLLVLRGGQYPPHNAKKPPDEENGLLMWPPIDDYKAPPHQVKIPKNPKVPPPFPVPFQIFAGTQNAQNQTDSTGATQEASKATNPDPSHATAGQAAVPIFEPGGPGEEWRGLPLPPSQTQLNGTWRPPFLEYLPPGAVILPPPDNRTEQIDEEDPSIYYPPPYTFYYRQDNTSKVPPGPLVPGIVLPPPPDFFAPLEEEIVNNTITTPTKLTTNKPHRTRKPITTQHLNTQINPTTTPLPPTTQKSVKIYPVVKTSTTTTTSAPTVVTILPVRQDRIYLPNKKRPQDVTVLRPVQPQTTKSPHRGVYVYENEIPNKPYVQYATPTKKKTYSTTQEPVEYYTTPKTVQVTPRGPQEIPNNHYLQYASPDNPQTTVTTTKVPAKYYDTSIHQEGPYVQYTSKKTTTPPPARYHTITTSEEVTSNPYVQFATSGGKKKIIVSTTQVPLKYYTTSNNLEVNPGKVKTTSKPKVVPSDYFYYEETEKNRQTTTQKPRYYHPSTEGYYIKPSPRPRRPQYIYVSAKPYNTQKPRFRPVKSRDSFSVHVAKIQKHINQYLPTSRPSPKPVYQYSFEANGYKSTKGKYWHFLVSRRLDFHDLVILSWSL
ncbi:unnamed protein product [Acanthoscelides obtectus]|uniref:Uncharacterized protein n=1 Tax=Acanthoscelides obtectus TaxID=200917 RepID=A0A9P0Q1C7_ACAOB|nr:unnamed protein product [Acanthoscelides obtectus]CAK1642356.1 hypothetical protein AOBTE_LOCUS12995 [Acanthoscelides obtectus]